MNEQKAYITLDTLYVNGKAAIVARHPDGTSSVVRSTDLYLSWPDRKNVSDDFTVFGNSVNVEHFGHDIGSFFKKRKQLTEAHQTFYGDWKMQTLRLNKSEATLSETAVCYYDIETKFDPSQPFSMDSPHEIISISFVIDAPSGIHEYLIWCVKGHKYDGVTVVECENEEDLLSNAFRIVHEHNVTIMSAWNGEAFDDVICQRRTGMYPSTKNKMSPYYKKAIDQELVTRRNKVAVKGMVLLDAMILYQTFTFGGRASYKIDYIAKYEGHESGKQEYEGTLMDLYNNDPHKFGLYNIQDARLVAWICKKCMLLENAMTLAQTSKIPIGAVTGQTSVWRSLVDDAILSAGIYPEERQVFSGAPLKGAYVDATRGVHRDIATFDYASLYPNSTVATNNSPETFLGCIEGEYEEVDAVLPGEESLVEIRASAPKWHIMDIAEIKSIEECSEPMMASFVTHYNAVPQTLKELKKGLVAVRGYDGPVCIAPNGAVFRTDRVGILPALISKLFLLRKAKKKEQLRYESLEYEIMHNIDNF